MAEVVNLRLARKAKRRAEADRAAATNRAIHGRARVERDHAAMVRELSERRLDEHRRDDTP